MTMNPLQTGFVTSDCADNLAPHEAASCCTKACHTQDAVGGYIKTYDQVLTLA
jgi:hypothetical protein